MSDSVNKKVKAYNSANYKKAKRIALAMEQDNPDRNNVSLNDKVWLDNWRKDNKRLHKYLIEEVRQIRATKKADAYGKQAKEESNIDGNLSSQLYDNRKTVTRTFDDKELKRVDGNIAKAKRNTRHWQYIDKAIDDGIVSAKDMKKAGYVKGGATNSKAYNIAIKQVSEFLKEFNKVADPKDKIKVDGLYGSDTLKARKIYNQILSTTNNMVGTLALGILKLLAEVSPADKTQRALAYAAYRHALGNDVGYNYLLLPLTLRLDSAYTLIKNDSTALNPELYDNNNNYIEELINDTDGTRAYSPSGAYGNSRYGKWWDPTVLGTDSVGNPIYGGLAWQHFPADTLSMALLLRISEGGNFRTVPVTYNGVTYTPVNVIDGKVFNPAVSNSNDYYLLGPDGILYDVANDTDSVIPMSIGNRELKPYHSDGFYIDSDSLLYRGSYPAINSADSTLVSVKTHKKGGILRRIKLNY